MRIILTDYTEDSQSLEDDSFIVSQVEDIFRKHGLAYMLVEKDVLVAEVEDDGQNFILGFSWDEKTKVFFFDCRLNWQYNKSSGEQLHILVSKINSKVGVGHFEIDEDTYMPVFRHTAYLPSQDLFDMRYVTNFMSISIEEWKRFLPHFSFALQSGLQASEIFLKMQMDELGLA